LCTHTITVNPNAAITNSGFSFNVDVDQPQGRFTGPVTGTFSSATAGSITLGSATSSSYTYRLTCGNTVVTGIGSQAQTGTLSKGP
jgi:hypothetical protein